MSGGAYEDKRETRILPGGTYKDNRETEICPVVLRRTAERHGFARRYLGGQDWNEDFPSGAWEGGNRVLRGEARVMPHKLLAPSQPQLPLSKTPTRSLTIKFQPILQLTSSKPAETR